MISLLQSVAAALLLVQEHGQEPAASPATTPTTIPAPTPPAAKPRPNLVLITLDTTRADHLGCYGYKRPTSPVLDALAAESVLFERCYATIPHTTPSHCSILTGVYPIEHGIRACSFRADEETQAARAFAPTQNLRTYTQILAEQGWTTGGFVTAATTKRITGLAVGFEGWSEPENEVRPGAEALADALAWLATAPEPFFLWVHFFDAHAPPREKNTKYLKEFAPDASLREHMATLRMTPMVKPNRKGQERAPRNPNAEGGGTSLIVQYDAGIRLMDDHVRDLRAALEARGAWPRTTVVVTGDHGEGLGQHGFNTHGPVWNEGLRVPFFVRAPGHAPQRIATVVSSIDVLATAIDLTPGLPRDEFFAQARGRSAVSPDFEERPVFSLSPPKQGEFALTASGWKYIRRENGTHALFDLAKDPFELNDVTAQHADVAAGFDKQMELLIRDQTERRAWYARGAKPEDLTPAEIERQRRDLAAIGYTEEGDETEEPPADGADDEEHGEDDEEEIEPEDGDGEE